MTTEPLITWKDWADGIGDSPHVGTALLQCVEIGTFPGAARVGKLPLTSFLPAASGTFTAVAATDICTSAAMITTANTTGNVVQLTTTGTLPGGLSPSTNYFVIRVDQLAGTFKLATTIANANAGTAINITDAGTGVHTVTTLAIGTINHYATDPRTGTTFCIDSNGRVWYNDSGTFQLLNGNTLTNASGQGIAVFRVSDGSATYLFAFRNALVDVVNVLGTTQKEAPSWTNGWQSMNSGAGASNSHYALLGQDNIIYFCDDRYVGSIAEKAGQVFDPSSGATYTYNNQALDLPLGSLNYWLEQLGVNLLIAPSNDGFLYPWDRTSDSYGLPIPVGENGLNKMKNIGNIVYLLAGTRGNIYWTQGTYVRPFKTIPYFLSNGGTTTPTATPVTWGGIGSADGKLIVGVGASSGRSGVYMIDPNGVMTLDNVPSTGAARVTAFLGSTEFYQMGYAGGADHMDTTRYSSLGTVILQSPLYRIGNKVQKSTISEIEYQIATGVTGSIRVGYRTDIASAFTTLTTFTTSASAVSDNYDAGLTDLEAIQFQVELSGNIDLMEFRAYK